MGIFGWISDKEHGANGSKSKTKTPCSACGKLFDPDELGGHMLKCGKFKF